MKEIAWWSDRAILVVVVLLLPAIILFDWLAEKEKMKNRRLYGDGYYRYE